jgi:hypothetical protein
MKLKILFFGDLGSVNTSTIFSGHKKTPSYKAQTTGYQKTFLRGTLRILNLKVLSIRYIKLAKNTRGAIFLTP